MAKRPTHDRTLSLPASAASKERVIWHYRIGGQMTVIRSPDGKRYNVPNSEIKGVTPATFERGQDKQSSDGMIYPSEIRCWIEALDKSAGKR